MGVSYGEVTAVMANLRRPVSTQATVDSLVAAYPGIRVLVAEQDRPMTRYRRAGVLRVSDRGVSHARNRLLDAVTTRYVLVGDNDYHHLGGLDHMLGLLATYQVVGGRVWWRRRGYRETRYDGVVDESRTRYTLRPASRKWRADGSIPVDTVVTFAVAETETLRRVGRWDERYRIGHEHPDWCLSMRRNGVTVGLSMYGWVVHQPDGITEPNAGVYRGIRKTDPDDPDLFKAKWGKQWVDRMRQDWR